MIKENSLIKVKGLKENLIKENGNKEININKEMV
jgi:hypothetical protein